MTKNFVMGRTPSRKSKIYYFACSFLMRCHMWYNGSLTWNQEAGVPPRSLCLTFFSTPPPFPHPSPTPPGSSLQCRQADLAVLDAEGEESVAGGQGWKETQETGCRKRAREEGLEGQHGLHTQWSDNGRKATCRFARLAGSRLPMLLRCACGASGLHSER